MSLKGIVSWDGLSTETIGVLFRPKTIRRVAVLHLESRASKMYDVSNGNWRCKMAGAGIRPFAEFRGQLPRIATTGITSWQTALK
jgi:hypothetical protein